MQRVKNYGSFLQAYSLKHTIEALGHTVEFVDYEVGERVVEKRPNLPKLAVHGVKVLWNLRRKNYREVRRLDFLGRFDTEYFPQLGLSEERRYRTKVDTLVIGSDEVFHCLQAEEDVGYSKELFGERNNASRLISYAASFGATTLQGLRQHGIADEIGRMLAAFDAISVRDENSGVIVRSLARREPAFHLDPVFLYDYAPLMPASVPMRDYIVVYAYSDRIAAKEAQAIRAFAKAQGKTLVSIGTRQFFCDYNLVASPFELLSYIKNADYIVTDTFHGAVFSVKYNKQFAVLVRDSNRQKLRDLLGRFALEDREVRSLQALPDILRAKVAYEPVNEIIARQVQNAVEYLQNNL